MIHKKNEIVVLNHKKGWNLVIRYNIDRHRGYYAKWNKTERERQTLYDFYSHVKESKKLKQRNKHNKTETEL